MGLPHSDSRSSTLVDSSLRTIVAFHVLLRLLVPRYPPYALCSLTYIGSFIYLNFGLSIQYSLFSLAASEPLSLGIILALLCSCQSADQKLEPFDPVSGFQSSQKRLKTKHKKFEPAFQPTQTNHRRLSSWIESYEACLAYLLSSGVSSKCDVLRTSGVAHQDLQL